MVFFLSEFSLGMIVVFGKRQKYIAIVFCYLPTSALIFVLCGLPVTKVFGKKVLSTLFGV